MIIIMTVVLYILSSFFAGFCATYCWYKPSLKVVSVICLPVVLGALLLSGVTLDSPADFFWSGLKYLGWFVFLPCLVGICLSRLAASSRGQESQLAFGIDLYIVLFGATAIVLFATYFFRFDRFEITDTVFSNLFLGLALLITLILVEVVRRDRKTS